MLTVYKIENIYIWYLSKAKYVEENGSNFYSSSGADSSIKYVYTPLKGL